MKINKKLMSKPVLDHFCEILGHIEFIWRPVEVVCAVYPETLDLLNNSSPAIAAYCKPCGELWVVYQRDV